MRPRRSWRPVISRSETSGRHRATIRVVRRDHDPAVLGGEGLVRRRARAALPFLSASRPVAAGRGVGRVSDPLRHRRRVEEADVQMPSASAVACLVRGAEQESWPGIRCPCPLRGCVFLGPGAGSPGELMRMTPFAPGRSLRLLIARTRRQGSRPPPDFHSVNGFVIESEIRMTPGRKVSTTTSALCIIPRTAPTPASVLRSTARPFLFRSSALPKPDSPRPWTGCGPLSSTGWHAVVPRASRASSLTISGPARRWSATRHRRPGRPAIRCTGLCRHVIAPERPDAVGSPARAPRSRPEAFRSDLP